MGFGNSGFAPLGGLASSLSKRGVETSNQSGSDTDLFVFNMSSSVIIGGDLDTTITDPPTPVIVGVDLDEPSHQVATSVEVV